MSGGQTGADRSALDWGHRHRHHRQRLVPEGPQG
ncbi:MAG: YpsA SLOG family protein [Limisphaerales bacterium]